MAVPEGIGQNAEELDLVRLRAVHENVLHGGDARTASYFPPVTSLRILCLVAGRSTLCFFPPRRTSISSKMSSKSARLAR